MLDGWRITSVRPPEKQAVLSSWTEIGWRVGNLAAGAGALYLADQIGWKGAYLCMAGLMLIGKHWNESTIYKAADAYEKSHDWKKVTA